MGEANTHHDKLRSRIILATAEISEQGELKEVSGGTLSGLARLNSDGAKVLVTNLHVITGTHIFSQSL